MDFNGNSAAKISSHTKRQLDITVSPQDVIQRLGEYEWSRLCDLKRIHVLEARVDELEADLPDDPEGDADAGL